MYLLPDGFKLEKDEVIRRTAPPAGATVLLSGTLIEGIGNIHSDLDVYCISDCLPKRDETILNNFRAEEDGAVRQIYDYLGENGTGFDVEYYTWEEIYKTFSNLSELYTQSLEKTKIFRPTLAFHEEDLLHKFFVADVICGDVEKQKKFTERYRQQFCFLKYRNFCGGYPEFKDILGTYISQDWDTCIMGTREFLESQAYAMTFLAGDSNPKRKWLATKLKRTPTELQDISLDILHWLNSGTPTDRDKQAHVRRALALVDKIYMACRSLLESSTTGFDVEEAKKITAKEYELEEIKDRPTKFEFEHRHRQFSDDYRSIQSHLDGQ